MWDQHYLAKAQRVIPRTVGGITSHDLEAYRRRSVHEALIAIRNSPWAVDPLQLFRLRPALYGEEVQRRGPINDGEVAQEKVRAF